MKAVIDIDNNILFTGTHEECITFMNNSKLKDIDLRYLNDDGTLGRLSSWVFP